MSILNSPREFEIGKGPCDISFYTSLFPEIEKCKYLLPAFISLGDSKSEIWDLASYMWSMWRPFLVDTQIRSFSNQRRRMHAGSVAIDGVGR